MVKEMYKRFFAGIQAWHSQIVQLMGGWFGCEFWSTLTAKITRSKHAKRLCTYDWANASFMEKPFAARKTGFAAGYYHRIRYGFRRGKTTIGCPRIIRTCIFPQLSLLRWNRWRRGYQNFMAYSSKGKTKCHTLQKSPHDPVQPLFPVRAEKLLFPLCPSTKQAIIDKGRNPRFHNRAISIKFAGEPVNRVWNQLDISRTQIFQQLRCAKTKSGLIGKLGWNRKSRPFPDATKMLAIVAERCYQKTCKLTNNQT